MLNGEHYAASNDLSIDQINDHALSIADYEKALDVHTRVLRWVLSPDNLDTHARAMFMHAHAYGKIREALSILMAEFVRIDRDIPASEPQLWTEWATYWQRGFDPIGTNQLQPSPDSIEQLPNC